MIDTSTTTNEQTTSTELKKLQQTKVAGNVTINSIDELQRLGQILSQSGFFEDCKQAAQAAVKILAGSELGFPAFSSMVGIHIIKGKPAIGANLIAAAIKRSGCYDYRVLELSDHCCKIAFLSRGNKLGFQSSVQLMPLKQELKTWASSLATCCLHALFLME